MEMLLETLIMLIRLGLLGFLLWGGWLCFSGWLAGWEPRPKLYQRAGGFRRITSRPPSLPT